MTPRPILKSRPFAFHFPFLNHDSNYSDNQLLTPGHSSHSLPFASSSCIPPLDSPHVHFPPTPTMTRMEMTHSSLFYDRKPIVVSPNLCSLPRRGERNMDALDEPNDDDDYFHAKPYYSGLGDAISSTPTTFGSGPIPSSDSARINRIRCHSLPLSPPPQTLASRPFPHYHRHHTDPDMHHQLSQAPPLIFDSSSYPATFQDIYGPVPAAYPPIPTQSHDVPMHFPPSCLKQAQGLMKDLQFTNIMNLPVGVRKKSKVRRPNHLAGKDDTGGQSLALPLSGAPRNRKRTRQVVSGSRSSRDFRAFCEPDLDGCLGGF